MWTNVGVSVLDDCMHASAMVFLAPLIVLSVLFCHKKQCTLVLLWDSDGKCIVAAELCDADAGGGTTLYEEVWRHVSTSFADSRCRMSITNMTYIAEIRLHFQTNYVALRL